MVRNMWMVYDIEKGIVVITSDIREANMAYLKCKKATEESCSMQSLMGEERVILAKMEKQLFARPLTDREKARLVEVEAIKLSVNNDNETYCLEEERYGI